MQPPASQMTPTTVPSTTESTTPFDTSSFEAMYGVSDDNYEDDNVKPGK